MDLSKRERVQIFFARLAVAPPASTATDALQLLSEILKGVEDEFTDVPYASEQWKDDGRMYPPQEDSIRGDELPEVIRYRNKGHNTRIHSSGAIRIETTGGVCLLNKPSANGHLIP